jgi:dihydroorotate dehydrogenase (NAD+) catalytic subunit
MQPNISVNIGKLKLKNPVLVASGTFGYAEEFKDFIDLRKLGALVTKTITLKACPGNPAPRTCETPAGMLNAIGLENPGLEIFIKEKLPALAKIGPPVVVSISAENEPGELVRLAKELDSVKEAAALELNISCPNIKWSRVKGQGSRVRDEGLRMIAQDPHSTYAVVRSVRKVTGKTLITKLSPNVAEIAEIALAAQGAGSDAVSLINTLIGMSIDIQQRRPKLAAVTGGLSGPAVRPVAVRMVWEAYKKIKIPIIGMGGIMDTNSALEFIIAGASAVAIGTANFINPCTAIEVISGIKKYLIQNRTKDIHSLIGSLKICGVQPD